MRGRNHITLALCLILAASAQRVPVLRQIDLPHDYYFREMYLPQLTNGPSSVAWLPDSQTVIYSMQGTLWRQRVDSGVAAQLTNETGYDYQPDVSRDGKLAVFTRMENDSLELWLLDLAAGTTTQLTRDGAVNLEPRWSPEGKHIAYVSTAGSGHFHIFRMDLNGTNVIALQQLVPEHKSELPRYYYSAYDHELSPTWSPDGKEIIFISNRGHIHGTGGFWRMAAEPGAAAREIRYEETTWKARPDWSPDGRRVVVSSYLGGSWNQLWLMTAEGGDVFPITYGDYDNTAPRWSPDGTKIAFVSNRDGELGLFVREVPGGAEREIRTTQRKYLSPKRHLKVSLADSAGRALAGRISITAEGRAVAPLGAWMQADDSLDHSVQTQETRYFLSSGTAEVEVCGRVRIEARRGLEYGIAHATRASGECSGPAISERITLKPLPPFRDKSNWVSGDVHVHMNYAGTYRATPKTLLAQMQAEDLPVVQNLLVNKEQRFPDVEYSNRVGQVDRDATGAHQILHGQEYHSSYWGHVGLLNITSLVLPGYVSYPNTAAASLYPMNAHVADIARRQNKDALVGYVHPYAAVPDPEHDATLTSEFPVDVALGKVDYYEVIGFNDHKASAAVWYKLLNLGFRLPAAAGTDAMTNYASLRGPVGLNRVYVELPRGPLKMPAWLEGLKRGRTFATNGPLLRFTLGGQSPGGEVKPPASSEVRFTAAMRSLVPVDQLQIVCNGEVVKEVPRNAARDSADASGTITLSHSGWCLLRAWAEKSDTEVLDIYPYATTSPVYVTVGGTPPRSPEDAKYFVAWIARLIVAAGAHTGYNTPAEKEEVLRTLEAGRRVYVEKSR